MISPEKLFESIRASDEKSVFLLKEDFVRKSAELKLNFEISSEKIRKELSKKLGEYQNNFEIRLKNMKKNIHDELVFTMHKKLLNLVLDQSRSILVSEVKASSESYRLFLKKQFESILPSFSGFIRISCRKEDYSLLKEMLNESPGITAEYEELCSRNIPGGFIIFIPDSFQKIDVTLETRFSRMVDKSVEEIFELMDKVCSTTT